MKNKNTLNALSWIFFFAFAFICVSNIVIIAAGNFHRDVMLNRRAGEFILFIVALGFVVYELNWDNVPDKKTESLIMKVLFLLTCTLLFIGSLVSETQVNGMVNMENSNVIMLFLHMLSFFFFLVLKIVIITKNGRYKEEKLKSNK